MPKNIKKTDMGKECMYFPNQIRKLRKYLNESQEEFGKHFEVSHAAVSDWESGKSEAPYKVLEWALFQGEEVNEMLPFPHPEDMGKKVYRMNEPLQSQIDRLATFIETSIPGEPSENEGAIDTAIRLLKNQFGDITKKDYSNKECRCHCHIYGYHVFAGWMTTSITKDICSVQSCPHCSPHPEPTTEGKDEWYIVAFGWILQGMKDNGNTDLQNAERANFILDKVIKEGFQKQEARVRGEEREKRYRIEGMSALVNFIRNKARLDIMKADMYGQGYYQAIIDMESYFGISEVDNLLRSQGGDK